MTELNASQFSEDYVHFSPCIRVRPSAVKIEQETDQPPHNRAFGSCFDTKVCQC